MTFMNDWTEKLFIERPEIFLKLMNQRWARTEELVNGMVKILKDHGITSGRPLDLCCGNGRISVHMAKRGFRTVGVDMSPTFLEDAKRKADENGVSDMTSFLHGDVRKLKNVIGKIAKPFDVVVDVWTSIGFSSPEDDLKVFKQARELARSGAILFIAETTHNDYISLKFFPTSYEEVDGLVLLENRTFDPTRSMMRTTWSFYEKQQRNLIFIDKADLALHVYSVSELSTLLRRSGWEPVAFYGNLTTLQPMSALTRMDLVAKAS